MTDYMNQIKDAHTKNEDLKIIIDDAVVFYAFNNLESQFRLFLTILNFDTQQKV